MSYKNKEDKGELSETEYNPTEEDQDLHEKFAKLNRKLESLYKEEANIRKELRMFELKLRKKIKLQKQTIKPPTPLKEKERFKRLNI